MANYGWTWRTVIRPRILKRAGGQFNEKGKYTGSARCERCNVSDHAVLSVWLRSQIQIAHLDGSSTADEDLAALCSTCHSKQDYPEWARKFRAWLTAERNRRIEAKDAERPILVMLEEAS
jgi:hypothetical protein